MSINKELTSTYDPDLTLMLSPEMVDRPQLANELRKSPILMLDSSPTGM